MNNNTLKTIIDTLLSDNYYNAGECVEIAKGKYEYADKLTIGITKIKRLLK